LRSIFFLRTVAPVNADSKKTQQARILALLLNVKGAWVPLPDLLALGVAQYNSRILELRRLGFHIENRRAGQHSAFRLVLHQSSPIKAIAAPASETPSLFGDLRREVYPD
jgi:hypothetical protein